MRRVAPLVLAGTLLLALALPAGSPGVSPDPNPWRGKGFLNIAHQGGEDEAPSETMFALKTAVRDRGADMLELDVNLTADGHLVVIHDDTVNRTTEETRTRDTGFSQVRDLDLSEIQALDAAYTFTNSGTYTKAQPPENYPHRGIADGLKPPPAGYTATDFRIPTLVEVLNEFPNVPINIEIKMEKHQGPGTPGGGCVTSGPLPQYCDNETESEDIAEELADVLTTPPHSLRNDIIVVSFSDHLIEHFDNLAPDVALAPGLTDTASYVITGLQPDPDVAAFQVPPSQGPATNVPETIINIRGAHQQGYAVHVWPNGPEGDTEAEYKRFVDLGVEGYMASKPLRLHNYLCANEVPRPDGSDRCPSPAEKEPKKCKRKKKTTPKSGLIVHKKKGTKRKCKKKKGKKKGKKKSRRR